MQDRARAARTSSDASAQRPKQARRRQGAATLSLTIALLTFTACSTKGRSGATQTGTPASGARAPRYAATTDSIDWRQVDQAMGRSGAMQPGGVYKFSMPRSDLHVTVNGVTIKPALSLGSWLAMKPRGNDTVVAMGDLVLTQDEVGPVMAKLQEGGVMQTALHNHLLHESPRLMYMHIHGEGDPVKLAQAVHAAVALTKTPAETKSGSASAAPLGLDTAQIHRVLGHGGKVSGGVYQVSIPRPETIRTSGIEVPPSMGTATSINFQPTGGGKAAINGDFVMTASEVNPVIRALTDNGITVVALHNHMLSEEPRLFFMHYWANDDAMKLARGLRQALDQMHGSRGATQ